MQEYKMRFLRKTKQVTMFDKLCKTAIQESITSSHYFSGSKDLSLDGMTI